MLKKIIVLIGLITVVGFSFRLISKTKRNALPQTELTSEIVVLPKDAFTFNAENLTPKCLTDDEMLCAVEKAVKCTIAPEMEGCSDANLPKFIFMKDPSLERPTEISYKITNKKALPSNNTVEIHTDSACNSSWFGLCQGTVIYVLAQDEDQKWFIHDIYAIE